MRGGALRTYQPDQRGRGLGGVIKKAASYLGQRYVIPYLKRAAKRRALKVIKSIKRKLPFRSKTTKRRKMMTGGALKGRRRPARRQKRRIHRDIFKY